MRHPIRHGALLALLLTVAAPSLAATAKEMYAAAVARQEALRTAEAGPAAPTLKEYRGVVLAFETIVRRHPASGYADNALWEGAQVASAAFARFRDPKDLSTSQRLLIWLVEQYPGSPLVRKARDEQKRLGQLVAAPEAPPAAAAAARPAADAAATSPSKSEPRRTPVSAPKPEVSAAPVAVLRDIHRSVQGDIVRLVMELDEEVAYRTERVENPPRVLFDLSPTRLGPELAEGTLTYGGEIVRRVRVGRHPNLTTRVVVDLSGVERYSVFTLYGPYRIIVDCERGVPAAAPPASPARALPDVIGSPPSGARAERPSVPAARPAPERVVEDTIKVPPPEPEAPPVIEARTAVRTGSVLAPSIGTASVTRLDVRPEAPRSRTTAPAPAPTPRVVPPLRTVRSFGPSRRQLTWAPTIESPKPLALPAPAERASVDAPPAPPVVARSANRPPDSTKDAGDRAEKSAPPLPLATRGGFSLARQLGLGASRIVLDPGHGGHDPGAEGTRVFEAAIVLDVSLRLEKLLVASGNEVVLTRRTDEFVPLEERTAIANRAQGDLFLSIHANASRNKAARGVESYFLNFASNPDAEAVAARENAATGRTMSSLPDIVRAITLNNKLDESRSFAGVVQKELVDHLKGANTGLRNHGVKQAPFVVLIGASMPSVLVEISFITNKDEGRLLKTEAYRQKIAEALFDAVRGYQRSLKGAPVPTHQ